MQIIDARKHNIIHRNGTRNSLGQFIKGVKLTKGLKRTISKGRKGMKFSAEHCRKISVAKSGMKNPAYGKTGFESYRGRQVLCVETGETFGSILDAARKMNVGIDSIRRNADQKIKNPKKYHWIWIT